MTCIFCTERPVDPRWDPYCGPECSIDAEGELVTFGVTLSATFGPVWTAFQKTKRACWPKVQHPSRDKAAQHSAALVSRGVQGDLTRLRVYRCAHCDTWHVGHRGRV